MEYSVQFSRSVLSDSLSDPMGHSTQGLPVHHQLLEFTQTHVHWVGDASQSFHHLSSPYLPALNLSQNQGLFKWVILCIRWPKYWSFSFNVSLSNEHSSLISFRMDWLDLLAVQGTLKTLLQYHSSKTLILQCSAFFIVQLSGSLISFRIFHSLLWSTQSNVFLELSCFFVDPADVVNLISGSSAFSKTSLNIWKFRFHVLLKPCLENFEHYFTSVWDECNCAVVWAFFGIAFLCDRNENWPFPVLWPLLSFPNLLTYWVQHFHSIIFQDLK